ncbi:MAG: hypothetical protein RLZZ283_181 [Candidatus Parcubacteria bacterium]|jgi:hypothetical protein
MDQDMQPSGRGSMKKIFFVVIALLIIAAVVYLVMRQNEAPATDTTATSGNQVTEEESRQIVAAVGKLFVVPTGEDPIVARVTDANALIAEQLFYKDIQNGDYLLIYPAAAKAIIYSPSRNVLVNVGPIQVPEGGSPTGTTPAK